MHTLSRSASLLIGSSFVLALSFGAPLFAGAVSCSTLNTACDAGGVTGYCAQNQSDGSLYCKACDVGYSYDENAGCVQNLNTTSSGGTSSGVQTGVPSGTATGGKSAAQVQCESGGGYWTGSYCGSSPTGTNLYILQGYGEQFKWVVNYILVPVLVALAFITFLFGVYRFFILGADNESERAKGRQLVLWGVIGFVVLFSVWGLVNIVKGTLNFDQAGGNVPNYPKL